MVRIRLRRTGAKNNPAYRVVVADQNSPRDGAFIDTIGYYLPTRTPAVVEIDEEKARKWLAQGAQPSETAASLLRQKGLMAAKVPRGMSEPVENTSELNPSTTEADDIMAAAMDDERLRDLSADDTRLIELVGYLVQGIVSHPDDVEVEEFFDDVGSVYGVRVHPEDVGRVIGKEGRIANALRHLVKAAATKSGARVSVEIITDESSLGIAASDDPQADESRGSETPETDGSS